jgi:hypothetical protein
VARTAVLQIFTSNYEPAPCIGTRAEVVAVTAPSLSEQQAMCSNMLAEVVRATTGAGSVRVDLQAFPPVANDMRPLDKWKASLCHHVAQALAVHAVAGDDLVLTVAGEALQLQVSFQLAGMAAPQPLLSLCSEDQYFFFPTTTRPHLAVMDMVRCNALKPGVIVLRGSHLLEPVEQAIRACMGAEQVRSTNVRLLVEADKEVVLGSPWDFPRGGLFKFIDDVNNPAGDHRRSGQEYAVIFAHVSATGQYILRELLEGNRSCTHRQMVRKDGVLFVLSLDDGAPVTETLISRAHAIV